MISTLFVCFQIHAGRICCRFILMCHLFLNVANLTKVGPVHPTTMNLITFGITMFLNTWYSIHTHSPLENFTWLLVHVINMQFGIRVNNRKYQPLVIVHSLAFGGRGCFFSSGRCFRKKCRIFNATLGYPGEGPKKKTTTNMTTTWSDLVGPMCIFLDEKWCDGNLIEVKEDHVLYSLDENPLEQFILQKDEAYQLIRTRKVVKAMGMGKKYNGNNPLIFGPHGACIYGKTIRKRKGSSKAYRVEIKFKPTNSAKVEKKNISLGPHVGLFVFCLACLLLARMSF